MKRAAIILLFIFGAFQQATGQKNVSIDLLKGSSLTIYGSSNVVPFKIHLKGDNFPSKNISISAIHRDNKIFVSESILSINVKNFTSENRMALKDFKKLIKHDRYPEISVEITSLEMTKKTCVRECSAGNATGYLTITGIKKEYNIPLSFNKFDKVFIAEGKIRINIKDFGLTPPTEMMGLIKVSEWIEVVFNLNLSMEELNPEKNSVASAL